MFIELRRITREIITHKRIITITQKMEASIIIIQVHPQVITTTNQPVIIYLAATSTNQISLVQQQVKRHLAMRAINSIRHNKYLSLRTKYPSHQHHNNNSNKSHIYHIIYLTPTLIVRKLLLAPQIAIALSSFTQRA